MLVAHVCAPSMHHRPARGKPMHLLDVGGGFPGTDAPGAVSFKEMAAALAAAIGMCPSSGPRLRLAPASHRGSSAVRFCPRAMCVGLLRSQRMREREGARRRVPPRSPVAPRGLVR